MPRHHVRAKSVHLIVLPLTSPCFSALYSAVPSDGFCLLRYTLRPLFVSAPQPTLTKIIDTLLAQACRGAQVQGARGTGIVVQCPPRLAVLWVPQTTRCAIRTCVFTSSPKTPSSAWCGATAFFEKISQGRGLRSLHWRSKLGSF